MRLAFIRPALRSGLALFLGLGLGLPRLRAEPETVPPTVIAVIPEPGAVHRLEYVEIQFSEPVTGVEAGDLKANEIPCLGVRRISPDIYSFTLPPLPPGEVRLEWRRSAAITDLAEVPNPFVGEDLRYTLLPPLRPGGVVVAEFMAANEKTLRDDDGDYEDWIELQNLTDEPVDLAGWHLTDEPDQPAKWTFPEMLLPARGFLVVFASGKNRVDPTRRLHTNFRLNNAGEYLGLTAPDGVPVSNFAPRYPALPADVAYGRAAGAPDQAGFLQPATPGAPNAVSG
ncbi:MAG: lamin tail domain-containing protein, partial [Verrucomicrobiota bacterium]